MKLRHTRLVTEDVPGLARFYGEITGIAPIGTGDYVELQFPTSGGSLAICSQRTMERHGARATAPAANRSAILDFEVDDVDQERRRILPIVPDLVLEPTNQPWGNRSMLFRDPDGNLINFFAPIAGSRPAPSK